MPADPLFAKYERITGRLWRLPAADGLGVMGLRVSQSLRKGGRGNRHCETRILQEVTILIWHFHATVKLRS